MRFVRISFLTLAVLAVAVGCGDEKAEQASKPSAAEAPAAAGAAPSAAATAEARTVFDTRCVACHGPGGQGDGPASAGLNPKPRDLSDPGWQSSVTDDHIEKIIMYGGAAVNKSPAMPANPDLAAKEAVVKALRELVRNLGS